MPKKNTKTRVLVPVSEKEFEALVDKLMLLYKFPSREHVTAIVANRIMHAPPDQDLFTLEYFASCIRKNIAYQLADQIGKNNAHKVGIEDLVTHLKANPGDCQARDQLQKHASEGSPFAKAALEELGIAEDIPKAPESEKAPENETLQ